MVLPMVSLIYVSDYMKTVEHLGTASIKAYLETKAIPTSLHTVYEKDDLASFVLTLPYDSHYFGFPLFHSNTKRVYELIKIIKKHFPKSIIFVGGPFATLASEKVLNDCLDIDFIVLGDGELPTYNAIQLCEKNSTLEGADSILTRCDQNKKVPGVVNLKEISWPARDYLEKSISEGNRNAKIYASRGCCGNCSFCSFNIYYRHSKNKCWYGREIEDVFNEIVFINSKYGIRDFTFVDGSFEDPGDIGKKRINKLCDLLLNYPIKMTFWCWLRAETFRESDIALISKMKKAGFIVVYVGFEANNESDLKIYKKRNCVSDNERTIQLFTRNKIEIEYGYIILNPYSTRETLKENYLFLKKHNVSQTSLYTNRCYIYYGTDIFYMAQRDGLLSSTYSYLNPLNYNYIDSFAEELSQFIDKYYYNSEIMTLEMNYLEFKKSFFRINHLFPEITNKYYDIFKELEINIGLLISSYFEIIYLENNLFKAQNNLQE